MPIDESEDGDRMRQEVMRAEEQLMQRIDEKKEEMLVLMTSMRKTIQELTRLRLEISHDTYVDGVQEMQKDGGADHENLQEGHRPNFTSIDDGSFLARVNALRAELAGIAIPDMNTKAQRTPTEKEERETNPNWKWPLSPDDYKRYGRQLIMPEIGLRGQLRLSASSVLIIGVGGLGCPAAAYLAGAGIGTIGLVDGDTVEASNLHRQILHNTARVGHLKVDSAVEYLRALNPTITYHTHPAHLTPTTALSIIAPYDMVLDCTDHPTSRYLISDACVILGKPLVSASALRTDGQLMALNYPPQVPGDSSGGPCYRCIFPKPPPAEAVVSCGEGGILGPVVGVMGVLQALQAIELLASGGVRMAKSSSSHAKGEEEISAPPRQPTLLIFSAFAAQPFRSIRLRSRRAKCASCSAEATITSESLTSGSLDYVAFCGVTAPVQLLAPDERIDVREIRNQHAFGAQAEGDKATKAMLVDVREKVQFDLCNLPGSMNVPWSDIQEWKTNADGAEILGSSRPVHVLCRLGNDSQLAVRKMKALGFDHEGKRLIVDVTGGLRAWKSEIDPWWPDF